jgi:type IV pilus assembly protein PilV
MKKADMKRMKNKQQGSFVLEALIAILLFAIGILAIVGLQAASIANSASSKYRTDASLLANQVIAQMWVADKTNATLVTDFCGPAASGVCAAPGANYQAWANAVMQVLPGASSVAAAPSIVIDASNVATITVFWQTAKDNAPHNYSTIVNIND